MTYIPPSYYIENYIPDLTRWTNTGVALPFARAAILKIGTTFYAFGGYAVSGGAQLSSIYTASQDNPTSWSLSVGNTLPSTISSPRACIVDGYIYIIGSYENVTNTLKIYRASVSNPLSWIDTEAVLPSKRVNAPLLLNSSYMFLPFGNNGSVDVNTCAKASLSNPLSWTDTTVTSGVSVSKHAGAVVDDDLYIFTGYDIRRITKDGTYCHGFSGYIPRLILDNPFVWQVGNSFWIWGFNNDETLARVEVDNPFVNVNMYYSVNGGSYHNMSIWSSNGYVYYIDAGSNPGRIYRSERQLVYSETPPIDSNRGLLAITVAGETTSITRSQRLGFPSWLTNRYDLV